MKKVLLLLLLSICLAVVWGIRDPEGAEKYLPVKWVKELYASLFGEEEKLEPVLAPAPPLADDAYVLREKIAFPLTQGGGFWSQGTLVKKVGEGGGKFVISDGTRQTIIDAVKLTRDPAEITAIRAIDEAQAEAMAVKTRGQLSLALKAVQNKLAAAREELAATQAKEEMAKQAGKPLSMATTSGFLQANINRLEKEQRDLEKRLAAMP